jgi:50S ribosomal subunit-associated GTPase HflX
MSFSIYLADIPTTLIEAFRATLNDAIDAHLIIHVCDISHPDYVVQQKTVMKTLLELDVPSSKFESMITVFNKYDLLGGQTSEKQQINEEKGDDDGDDEDDDEDAEEEKEISSSKPIPEINIENENRLYISCKTGQGLDQLVDIVQKRLMIASDRVTCEYRVLQGGQLYQALVNNNLCTIENMIVDENDPQFIHLKCLFSKPAYAKFQAHYRGASKYQISSDS